MTFLTHFLALPVQSCCCGWQHTQQQTDAPPLTGRRRGTHWPGCDWWRHSSKFTYPHRRPYTSRIHRCPMVAWNLLANQLISSFSTWLTFDASPSQASSNLMTYHSPKYWSDAAAELVTSLLDFHKGRWSPGFAHASVQWRRWLPVTSVICFAAMKQQAKARWRGSHRQRLSGKERLWHRVFQGIAPCWWCWNSLL